jgi:hypothetical protein
VFKAVYLQHRGSGAQLWEAAEKAGLKTTDIASLKLQGKLAFLAGNSETITTRLMKKLQGAGRQDPGELVQQGFHNPDTWKLELFKAADIPPERHESDKQTAEDREKLARLIPTRYPAADLDASLGLYTEDMARRLRLEYPTQVLGHLIENDDRFKAVFSASAGLTAKLLNNAIAQGFRIGLTPVTTFLTSREGLSNGLTAEEFEQASSEIRELQRIYQITPSNEAIPVLKKMSLTSALDVTAYSEEQFTSIYENAYRIVYQQDPPTDEARLIVRKSRQVCSITYNLFTIARKVDSDISLAAMCESSEVRENAKNSLIKHFPTMESLFGSTDYCECEHCRSVLSPAAYFVDLLQFLDVDPLVWSNTHAGESRMTPYSALIERRPDLPHIALTCENTNTAMPYIDIVNEILEYYVVNGTLNENAARDTGDAETAQLLAEPQHVISAAYSTLGSPTTQYPLSLPFDLGLETVRSFCEYFKAPLHEVLDAYRPDTDVVVAIRSCVNSVSPTTVIDNQAAERLKIGQICTIRRRLDNRVSSESKNISAIGGADSGGKGLAIITFADAWTDPPVAEDLLLCRPIEARTGILFESLGFTPAEVEIFVDSDPLSNDKWHHLFGFPSTRALISKCTNSAQAKISLRANDAAQFKSGQSITFFSNGNRSAESKLIVSIAAPDPTTGETLITCDGAWQTPPSSGDLLGCDVLSMLSSAKSLSRRLGITYKELTELVQTSFVNPNLIELRLLYKIGVSVGAAFSFSDSYAFYSSHKEFYAKNHDRDRSVLAVGDLETYDELLRKRPGLEVTGWDVMHESFALEQKLERLVNDLHLDASEWTPKLLSQVLSIPFSKVLVLADGGSSGSFDQTTLRYADGGKVKAFDLHRMNIFVRMWRKLGWSIEETDLAITVLSPETAPYDELPEHLTQQPLKTTLVYLAHLKELDAKLTSGQHTRLNLLTLWSDIPTGGRNSLYSQLFLRGDDRSPSVAFESPIGEYLTDVGVKLKDHLTTLQGSLGLSPEEFNCVLGDANLGDDPPLSIVAVSCLYRYKMFSRALGLTVQQLVTIKQLSGLDPFRPLHRFPLKTYAHDYPGTETLEFVKIAEELRNSDVGVDELNYLLRNSLDGSGPYRPKPATNLDVIRIIANGIRRITDEYADPVPAGEPSEAELRRKLSVGLPPDIVETFLSMVRGDSSFNASASAPREIPLSAVEGMQRIVYLKYDSVSGKQMLGYRGVLTQQRKNDLLTAFNQIVQDVDIRDTFDLLLTEIQLQGTVFFQSHLQNKQLGETENAGFLEEADFELIFNQNPVDSHLRNCLSLITSRFMPWIRHRLIRQFINQTLTAHLNANQDLLECLVCDSNLLSDTESPLAVFSATGVVEVTGLSSGASLAASQDTTNLGWYIEVPRTGEYRFYLELDSTTASAELRFPHLATPAFLRLTSEAQHRKSEDYIELKVGVLYRLEVTLQNSERKGARLFIHGASMPKGPITQLSIFSGAAIDNALSHLSRLSKALRIVEILGLNKREVRYFLAGVTKRAGMSLSDLPTGSEADVGQNSFLSSRMYKAFQALASYSRLKQELTDGAGGLISVFEETETEPALSEIAKLTRRAATFVTQVAIALETMTLGRPVQDEKALRQLWMAMQLAERFSIAPQILKQWSELIDPQTDAARRVEIAMHARNAVKSRFQQAAWYRIAQPIFDKLRKRQRDSLVAYVVHRHGFASAEEMYQYFLIDPGMEPAVQTSRLRLAISSVQLFIQLVLLNLVPKVSPSLINAKQWEWMKRYRVWEANRKIFLYPENWLEPEFRDDKTHLFSELEGSLLQGDVSSDLVENAFLTYLQKLDEIARLEISAMHLQDHQNPALRVLHVFGRTPGLPAKHFYRRYAHQSWTPWEPVTTSIQGNHLAPVFWRDRLYLFWITFSDKPDPNADKSEIKGKNLTEVTFGDLKTAVTNKAIVAQLHWTEYVRGKWSIATSTEISNSLVMTVDLNYDGSDARIIARTEQDSDGNDTSVHISIIARNLSNCYYKYCLAGRNSRPERRKSDKEDLPLDPMWSLGGTPFTFSGKFERILSHGEVVNCNNNIRLRSVLADAQQSVERRGQDLTKDQSAVVAALVKPAFVVDSYHTFFVEPTVVVRTIEQWEHWVQAEDALQSPEIYGGMGPSKSPDPIRHVVIPERPGSTSLRQRLGNLPSAHSASTYKLAVGTDWLLNPSTAFEYRCELPGQTGQSPAIVTGESAYSLATSAPLNVSLDSVVFDTVKATKSFAPLSIAGNGIRVIRGSGLGLDFPVRD